jgi:glucose-1-phosphate cytidylyltransferase
MNVATVTTKSTATKPDHRGVLELSFMSPALPMILRVAGTTAGDAVDRSPGTGTIPRVELSSVKTVILAGGRGTRLAEQTDSIPKPMVEIGGRPILWHIMKHYAHHGCRRFYVPLGYKGDIIKRFFRDYATLDGSMRIDLGTGSVDLHEPHGEDWKVDLVDTGLDTFTGGRVKMLEHELRDGTFMVTYGDGVSSVDLGLLLDFHLEHGRLATVTAVRPPARFGAMTFDGPMVTRFTEKPQSVEGWINGGFLVLEPGVFDYLEGSGTSLEAETLEKLADDGQLAAYRHDGFWQCMDTVRDLRRLEEMWAGGDAPWVSWDSTKQTT